MAFLVNCDVKYIWYWWPRNVCGPGNEDAMHSAGRGGTWELAWQNDSWVALVPSKTGESSPTNLEVPGFSQAVLMGPPSFSLLLPSLFNVRSLSLLASPSLPDHKRILVLPSSPPSSRCRTALFKCCRETRSLTKIQHSSEAWVPMSAEPGISSGSVAFQLCWHLMSLNTYEVRQFNFANSS